MARLAFSLLLVGALCAAARSADPSPADSGLKNTLALQTAMGHAKHFLLENAPRKAVDVLEEQLPRVNGNRAYLQLLGEAYRAYIKDLWLAHQDAQARRYLERLCILEPAAASDPALQPPAQPKPAPTPAPAPPVEQKPAAVFPNFAQHNPIAKKAATVRAKIDEGEDPFDLRKQRQVATAPSISRAAQLVARAEEEFRARHYAEARRFYEQAYQADPGSINPCRDRLAFCLLHQVVEQLNQPGFGGRSPAELQQQVQGALSLAPQLAETPTGRRLLSDIESRTRGTRPPQVTLGMVPGLQHRGRNPEGWLCTETAHFLIFHQQDDSFAERVAEIAERTCTDMSRKWFGNDSPLWEPKCELIMHPSVGSYTQMTQQSPTSPGHSSIKSESGRVIGRRMDIRLDHAGALEGVLPHEATHVVLAGQFGPFDVPRWADEGMAVLSEPAEKVEQHRQNLYKCQAERLLFGAQELMQMEKYPEPRRIAAFYAQSVFLVEFLTAQRGPQVFVEFMRDSLRQGYASSLQRHYGWSFAQLEQAWQQHLAGSGNRVAGTAPR